MSWNKWGFDFLKINVVEKGVAIADLCVYGHVNIITFQKSLCDDGIFRSGKMVEVQ